MEIESLLKHLLPEELFEYFELIEVKESQENSLSLYLDERKVPPPEHSSKQLVSNGVNGRIKKLERFTVVPGI